MRGFEPIPLCRCVGCVRPIVLRQAFLCFEACGVSASVKMERDDKGYGEHSHNAASNAISDSSSRAFPLPLPLLDVTAVLLVNIGQSGIPCILTQTFVDRIALTVERH